MDAYTALMKWRNRAMSWFFLFLDRGDDLLLVTFLLGLLVGSFLNVVIYRLPQGLSVSVPRSHCPLCGHVLSPLELVPVLSYLALGRKCKVCKTPIAWRYAGVELLTGLVYALVYFTFGYQLHTLFMMAFCSILIVIVFIDIDTHRIPDALTISILILAILQWLSGLLGLNPQAVGLKGLLLGGLVTGFPLALLVILGLVTGKMVMGMGDLKLMVTSGCLLGPLVGFYGMLYGFVFGGLGAVGALVVFKLDRKSKIAFGPYLAMGLWLAVLTVAR